MPYDRLQSAIAALKSQHKTLSNLIPLADNNPPSVHGSPLPSTLEEQSEGIQTPSRFATSVTRRTWASVTSLSDGASIWFDALDEPDGAEEFILDAAPVEPGAADDRILVFDSPSHSYSSGSGEESSADTDDEEEVARISLVVSDRGVRTGAHPVSHRTSLPSCPVADEGSLFAVFKKNVGKVDSTDILCAELFLTLYTTERILLALHCRSHSMSLLPFFNERQRKLNTITSSMKLLKL